MNYKSIIICILLPLIISSCKLQKDYKRPFIDIPTSWQNQTNHEPLAFNKNWWQQFEDPVLNDYIQFALANNKDLKIAVHRVRQAAADYGVVSSYLYPEIDLNILTERLGVSQITYALPPGMARTNWLLSPYFSLFYEIDIWDRVKNLSEASFFEVMSQVQHRRMILLTVVSAVASTYIELRKFDQQLLVSLETLKAREEALRIISLRYKGGQVSMMDVRQAESEVETARAAKTEYERLVTITENTLRVLLGLNPGPIKRGKTIDELSHNIEVPMGLPSDLLCQRPDIQKAEDELISSHANLASIKALFFPTLDLNGAYGASSLQLSNLFTNPANMWSIGITLFEPIFNACKTFYQVQSAAEIEWQALFNYLQVIQQAFKEVDNALISEIKFKELEKIDARKVFIDSDYLRLATIRYDNGETDYLNVLDAERKLFQSELDLAKSQSEHLKSYVDLYKSLGGGWIIDSDTFMLNQPSMKLD